MSTLNGTKLIGYAVSGAILLILADVAPKFAIGTTGLILLAVSLSRANQLSTLANWISAATDTTRANQNPVGPNERKAFK